MKKQPSIYLSILFFCVVFLSCCSSRYSVGDFLFENSGIETVEVFWNSGYIEVQQGTRIAGYEEDVALKNTRRMRYLLQGEKLKIEDADRRYKNVWQDKKLVLEIPNGIELRIETKTACIVIGSIEADGVLLKSESGTITGESICVRHTIQIETGEGNVFIGALRAERLEFSSRSGELYIEHSDVEEEET